MQSHILEIEIDIEDFDHALWCLVDVKCEKVDQSFDHEFGVKKYAVWEPKEADIVSARHAITNEPFSIKKLPKKLVEAIKAKALSAADRQCKDLE